MTAPTTPSPTIRAERDGNVVIVTMDAPRGNALSADTVRELSRALYQAEQLLGDVDAPDAGAVVLVGKPSVFCGGLDLKAGDALDRHDLSAFVDAFESVFLQLFALRAPVVAALTGPAIAGGAVLALACDERVAPLTSTTFEIGLNEVALGLPFPSAAFEIARYTLPAATHVDALMKARRYNQLDALSEGIVDELAADVVGAAMDRARAFAALPARALQKVKGDLRHDALTRARARSVESRRIFVESWSDPANGERRRAILASLKR